MSNHIGDTNKMVSETPISDSTPHNVADLGMQIRRLERQLNAANDRIKRLENWKQSVLEVEREWNANSIATMLGAKLGESQRKVIQREVPKLLARIKRLEEAGSLALGYAAKGDLESADEVWDKAKEAKL